MSEQDKKQPNVYQRLMAVMAQVKYVQKDKKQGMQYSIVSADKVVALVRPALLEHGVHVSTSVTSCTQNGNRTEMHGVVSFVNVDDPTDSLEVVSVGYGVDAQDKGPGKAMTYLTKTAVLKALFLESGDDPDYDQGPESDYKANAKAPAANGGDNAAVVAAKRMEDNAKANAKAEASAPTSAAGWAALAEVGNLSATALFSGISAMVTGMAGEGAEGALKSHIKDTKGFASLKEVPISYMRNLFATTQARFNGVALLRKTGTSDEALHNLINAQGGVMAFEPKELGEAAHKAEGDPEGDLEF